MTHVRGRLLARALQIFRSAKRVIAEGHWVGGKPEALALDGATDYRAAGDRFRDSGDWAKAKDSYELHLQQHPADAAIWVQLGHAQKEAGDLVKAEACYREGAKLMPEDGDVHLQLGRALQLQGRFADAIEAYQRSIDLEPGADAAIELNRLCTDVGEHNLIVVGEGALCFSVADLLSYLRTHSVMSGIQRVQAGIALNVMDDKESYFISHDAVLSGRGGTFILIDKALLKTIIVYASGVNVDHDFLKGLIEQVGTSANRIKPARGSTTIILGAFWGCDNEIEYYVASKRAGVRIGAFIYDLIPLSHPEYCDPLLVGRFSVNFAALAAVADFFLTASDNTRRTLEDYLSRHKVLLAPTETVRLAHTFTTEHDESEEWPRSLPRFTTRRYVAYVSTIEGRKNHLYVVQAWRKLMAEGVEVPDLVFAGRIGWSNGPILDLLAETNNLNGRVHLVHDLADAQLQAVYRHALFTVFTSFAEGWGLPVGESLMNGTPCVASSTSSIPEVGGKFVDYVDPYRLDDGRAVLKRMIEDDEYREGRKRQIAQSFVPRDWSDVSKMLREKLVKFEIEVEPRALSVEMPEGEVHRISRHLSGDFNMAAYMACPVQILLAEHFYSADDAGRWMVGTSGEIEFGTACVAGEEVVVHLEVIPAPGYEGRQLSVQVGPPAEPRAALFHLPFRQEHLLLRVEGSAGEDGIVSVRLDLKGPITPRDDTDRRPIGLGLRSIGYARTRNTSALETSSSP